MAEFKDRRRVEIGISREVLIQLFFFAAFAVVVYQLFLLIRPFRPGLLGAAMLVLALHPLQNRLQQRIRNPSVAALVLSIGTLLLAVGPLVCLGWIILKESANMLSTVKGFFEGWQNSHLQSLTQYLPPSVMSVFDRVVGIFSTVNIDLKQIILDNVGELGTAITAGSTSLARNTLLTIFNGIVMTLALFFAFRDGEKLLRWAISLIPMHHQNKEAIAERAYETFHAVIIGVFVTAAVQGLVATIGFLIAGVRLPVLLGLATATTSLLGASFLITVPVALAIFPSSHAWGIFLLVWGLLVVGLLDNFLKPLLIGSRARMPLVLIFFSIFGGLKLYGLVGVILGPVLLAAFLTFVQIYRKDYLR